MSRWGNSIPGAVAAALVVTVTGCGSHSDGPPTADSPQASSTRLAPAPTAFDPCSIPQSVLDTEQLHSRISANSDGSGGTQWRGCQWVVSDGYAASIRTTNITLQMIRENRAFTVAEELTIGGRPALTYHDNDEPDTKHICILNVDLKGGSVEFSLDNPASNRKTGNMDTCELGKNLAGKVVPLIPASA
ncbi:DUF3558 domain-containing protein [Nocardia sp. NPDC004068]|uniref:DUF3558 domain-containing protein n=1 Tax=Nocardia sp. NPDC004068 TaxID=3364303 RepID=UPI0036B04E0F